MEGYGPSTYGDHIADVYDSWYQERLDPAQAVAFLAPLAAGGRALELGVGTGRVAIPLRAAGVDVSGIDASEAMVAKLRAKPGGAEIPVAIGDFTELPVEGRFRLVYVPFTTFFALDDQDAQVRCMQRVVEHLEDGGRFVLDAFVPDLSRYSAHQSTTTVDTGIGHVWMDAVRHDPVGQVIEGSHLLVTEAGTRLYPLRVRYCWPSELDLMARMAGLRLEDRFGWYDRSAFGPDATRHVSVYRREPAAGHSLP